MKIFKLILLSLLLTGMMKLSAQDSIRIKVVNQYEAPVGKFVFNQKEYQTGADGYAVVESVSVDSVVFSGENYDQITIGRELLTEGKIISLKKKFTWKDLLNPMFYIRYGGLWLLLFIIFAETGLFAGFFLPGDSLLFVAGIYSTNLAQEFFKFIGLGSMQNEWLELIVLCSLIAFAGILGNTLGYWTGRKVGPTMYHWKDNLLFKQRYLTEAHGFYEKHGGAAIVFARFLPLIRTFAPIIAGIVNMDKKRFAFFNITGSIAWVVSMIFAGHFLQIWVKNQFGIELKDKLELIVIVIIAVTTAPVLWKFFFGSKKQKTSDTTTS
jgi:membrane-associated protein